MVVSSYITQTDSYIFSTNAKKNIRPRNGMVNESSKRKQSFGSRFPGFLCSVMCGVNPSLYPCSVKLIKYVLGHRSIVHNEWNPHSHTLVKQNAPLSFELNAERVLNSYRKRRRESLGNRFFLPCYMRVKVCFWENRILIKYENII